ncbi:MAG: CPBP family intramembrane metalloprotease [Sphingomonadales bacterium]|nr:CPBP family intramembrane metalloprotease [Sphingomonadales bacterium]
MTDQTASPAARAVLREFIAFLRQPRILVPLNLRAEGQARRWAWLTLLLVFGLLAVLLPLIGAWQKAFNLPAPNAFDGIGAAWLVPTVVLIAPPIEELLFRGWQRGSASALWLLACAVTASAVLLTLTSPDKALLAAGLLLGALVATPIGWFVLRKRPAPLGWFARGFPVIFYLAAAVFALFHLTNYPRVSLLAVPLVLPQLWAALVLGYIRQRIGLPAGILAHMVANACSIGLALATGG